MTRLVLGNARSAAAAAATLLTTSILAATAGPLRSDVVTAEAPDTGRRPAAVYAEGAPAGFAGGFGQPSCHGCHFQQELNSAPGAVTVTGVPERFIAGRDYPLTVTLERQDMRLGGFQLTARFKDGGAQAGTLTPGPGEDARVGIAVADDLQYAGHQRPGAALAEPDRARWSLVWTAPPQPAPVVFHVAANAANADETVEGDYIYTAVIETAPAP